MPSMNFLVGILNSSVTFGALFGLFWILAAVGFGRPIRFLLFPSLDAGSARAHALGLGLGVAFLLSLDSLLGSIGAFGPGPSRRVAAWLILAAASSVALVAPGTVDGRRRWALPNWREWWPLLLALPALGVLGFAAALPPGMAWATEFGGYDALSYHLQLPKEWFEAGRIMPLRDSVYSTFPGFVEGATLHVWTMTSFAPIEAMAGATQWMHAGMAVAASLVTGVLAASLLAPDEPLRARRWTLAVAACGMLGIPWVIVTGSLAYNDMAVVLLLATAMLAWVSQDASGPGRAGLAVGLALGAAVGAKLTAAGMAVLPFAVWGLIERRGCSLRATMRAAAFALPVAAAVLLPWLVRNTITMGAPLFPFAGSAPEWWSAEQTARFAAGHAAPVGTDFIARLTALWDHGFREGVGAAPDADPWLPQWGAAFAVGTVALVVTALFRFRTGAALLAMFAVQCGFWMLATHLKARFLLPCAVPLMVATALAFAPKCEAGGAFRRAVLAACAAVALLGWCLQPLGVLRNDPRMTDPKGPVANLDALGAAILDLGPGTKADADAAAAEVSAMPLAWWSNWRMPAGATLGCEGEADVFWCRTTPVWGTVWDGGPLTRVLRAHPDDPVAAVRALSIDEHLTHLAIGESMLARWKTSGWIDPILTPDRVRAVAALLNPVAHTVSGGVVYKVPLAQ